MTDDLYSFAEDSLERIQQYLVIDQEPKSIDSGVPPAYWPGSGDLRVENLSARYSRVTLQFPFYRRRGN